MKFGSCAVDASLVGAILGHTHRLPVGGAVQKGTILGEAEVSKLRAAGLAQVMAARLEADDLHENAAATQVARHFVDPHVRLSHAARGRVNVHATVAGLVEIDASCINHANGTREEVTIATVEPWHRAAPENVVATVKIIPFAVSRGAVEAVERRLVENKVSPIRVRAFQPKRLGLLLTTMPGIDASLLRRASRAQNARVRDLGSTIGVEVRCEHRCGPVASGLEMLVREQCETILVLGASAIVDRRDVIPAALQRLGGTIDHLGMPVEPGNLLMLGRLGHSVVFGLPGCARSAQLSGYDWVLQRSLANTPVTSTVIRGLGVGGLLKKARCESKSTRLESRPREPGQTPQVAGVLLAAGTSKRFGADNKLLAKVDGVPLVRHAASCLIASGLKPVVVVLGHESEQVKHALEGVPVQTVRNDEFALGMGTSVRAGIRALDARSVHGALIALADMPRVKATHIAKLLAAFDPDGACSVWMPVHDGRRGNPVLWSRRHFAALGSLSGDVGGRVLLESIESTVGYVEVGDSGIQIDVDTPGQLDKVFVRS